jgi:sugar fermentation stimulation protein A
MIRFDPPLIAATVIRRYKRFLVDVQLGNDTVVAHCPNTGSMATAIAPGWPAMLRHHSDPKRKLAYSLEMVQGPGGWIGVNTQLTNRIVETAIAQGLLAELAGYGAVRREVRYGTNSRIDLLLEDATKPPCYVEVKNVTMLAPPDVAVFPDAVTTRGRKHLEELTLMRRSGARAVIAFLIQRSDVTQFAPADSVDPAYGDALRHAVASGVEALAWRVAVCPQQIAIPQPVPVRL